MNTAEFRCNREFLGLPVPWVAHALGVTPDTIKRWERDEGTVNRYARLMMRHWVNDAQRIVSELTVALTKRKAPINAAKDDAPDLDMPPGWHRMIAARVAERTGLEIVWHA